jgi:hypothetical protein
MEGNSPTCQPPGLALHAQEAIAFVDDQIVPLDISQGQKHFLAPARQCGHYLRSRYFAGQTGVSHRRLSMTTTV